MALYAERLIINPQQPAKTRTGVRIVTGRTYKCLVARKRQRRRGHDIDPNIHRVLINRMVRDVFRMAGAAYLYHSGLKLRRTVRMAPITKPDGSEYMRIDDRRLGQRRTG